MHLAVSRSAADINRPSWLLTSVSQSNRSGRGIPKPEGEIPTHTFLLLFPLLCKEDGGQGLLGRAGSEASVEPASTSSHS